MGTEKMVAHLFPVGGKDYAYDVYSNDIVRLDDSERRILEDLLAAPFSYSNPPAMCDQTRGLDQEQVSAVASFLTQAKEEAIFQPIPVRSVASPPTKEQVLHNLSEHIMAVCLEVTQDCNLECEYCHFSGPFREYDSFRHNNSKAMPLDTAKAGVDFYLERTGHISITPSISFYGGEPLLAADTISQTVRYVETVAPESGCTFHLTTNGVPLTNPATREMLASHNISILVSVDGPPQWHDPVRHLKNEGPTHHLITRGLEALLAEYPDYYAEMVRFNAVLVSPSEEVFEFFEHWPVSAAAQAGAVRYSSVDTLGSQDILAALRAKLPAQSRRRKQVLSRRERFLRNRMVSVNPDDGLENLGKELLLRIAQRDLGPPPELIRPSGFCVPGTRKLFVTVDGDLGACEKVGRREAIGTLAGGFNMPAIQKLLERYHSYWSSECSHCLAQRFCRTCPALLRNPDQNVRDRQFQEDCAGQRSATKVALADYVKLRIANPAYIELLEKTIVV